MILQVLLGYHKSTRQTPTLFARHKEAASKHVPKKPQSVKSITACATMNKQFMQSYKSPPQELPRQQPTCEMESAGFAGGFAPMARIPQPENAKLYHQRQLPVQTFFPFSRPKSIAEKCRWCRPRHGFGLNMAHLRKLEKGNSK